MTFNFAGTIANFIMPWAQKFMTRHCLWKKPLIASDRNLYRSFGRILIERNTTKNFDKKKLRKISSKSLIVDLPILKKRKLAHRHLLCSRTI
jgi:hypothetical protein